jgi:Protein of unknown function (DUF1571)
MRRLLLCLPLCLLMAPSLPKVASHSPPAPQIRADESPPESDAQKMERLAREDPVGFLEQCLKHYDATIQGYTLTMEKQERLGGKLNKKEVIEVAFQDKPHSVFLHWLEGQRLAEAALYVEGENDGKMLVRPSGPLLRRLVVERDPDSEEAKQSGRFTLKEYGLKKGMERTLFTWKAARDKGKLHVEYLGEQKVKEAGDRACFVLKRTRYAEPEADGVTELTIFVDKENWLQVGSICKGEEGKLIGEYYFHDVKLNPEFKPEQFKRESLKP